MVLSVFEKVLAELPRAVMPGSHGKIELLRSRAERREEA